MNYKIHRLLAFAAVCLVLASLFAFAYAVETRQWYWSGLSLASMLASWWLYFRQVDHCAAIRTDDMAKTLSRIRNVYVDDLGPFDDTR
jgi:hypothetical protein